MAWNLPALPGVGTLATVANWAAKVRDSLSYLKGLAGPVLIEHTLLFALADAIKRNADNYLATMTGGLTFGAQLQAFGKDEGVFPGGLLGYVPNAAKNALVMAFRFTGAVDAPEMAEGVIPQARGKLGDGFAYIKSGTYVGNSAADRQIATGFLCKLVLIFMPTTGGVNRQWNLFSATEAEHHQDGVDYHEIPFNRPCLHAADGFVVGNGAQHTETANNGIITYTYVAFG